MLRRRIWPNGIIFHQPRFPWNKGSHFPSKKATFWGAHFHVFSVAISLEESLYIKRCRSSSIWKPRNSRSQASSFQRFFWCFFNVGSWEKSEMLDLYLFGQPQMKPPKNLGFFGKPNHDLRCVKIEVCKIKKREKKNRSVIFLGSDIYYIVIQHQDIQISVFLV